VFLQIKSYKFNFTKLMAIFCYIYKCYDTSLYWNG